MPFLKMRPSKEGRCQLQHRPAKHFCPYSTGQQESSLPSSFFLTPRNAGKDRLPWWQAHCTKVMPITRKKPCTNSRECTGTIVWPDDEKPFISIFSWLSPCSPSHLVLQLPQPPIFWTGLLRLTFLCPCFACSYTWRFQTISNCDMLPFCW